MQVSPSFSVYRIYGANNVIGRMPRGTGERGDDFEGNSGLLKCRIASRGCTLQSEIRECNQSEQGKLRFTIRKRTRNIDVGSGKMLNPLLDPRNTVEGEISALLSRGPVLALLQALANSPQQFSRNRSSFRMLLWPVTGL